MSDKKETFIVSEGNKFRECIEHTHTKNGIMSRTYHEENFGGSWGARKSIKEYNKPKDKRRLRTDEE